MFSSTFPVSLFRLCSYVSDWAFAIATTPLFTILGVVVILINAVALACLRTDMPSESALSIALVNLVCTFFFAAEMLIKLLAFGLSGYVADTFNLFDGAIVIFSLVDAIQSPFATTGVSVFRLARIMRLVRYTQHWNSMQVIILVVSQRMALICWTALLLVVACFIYCLVGFQVC